jgi:hypothetical protein
MRIVRAKKNHRPSIFRQDRCREKSIACSALRRHSAALARQNLIMNDGLERMGGARFILALIEPHL